MPKFERTLQKLDFILDTPVARLLQGATFGGIIILFLLFIARCMGAF